MEAAQSKRSSDEEARLDAQFHMSICEAGHNVVMLHMMRSMYELLQTGVFYNRQVTFRQRSGRSELLGQHRAINEALQARDPEAATAAVHNHLDFVASVLKTQDRANKNEKIAELRFAHTQDQ
jgi:GntR family transcriptional repressor for pyruvate dehydrogenase complex